MNTDSNQNLDFEIDATLAATLAPDLTPLPPPPATQDKLRRHLLRRLAVTPQDHALMSTVRTEEGHWRRIAPGVEIKALHEDSTSHAFLVRLSAGASLPGHPHPNHEECLVLEGEVHLGDLKVRAGDFHVARAGSAHGVVSSPSGGTMYVRSAGPAGYRS